MYDVVRRDIFPYMSTNVRIDLQVLDNSIWDNVEEIRLRTGRPLMLKSNEDDIFIKNSQIEQEEIYKTVEMLADNSIYTIQEELKDGYMTIKGGHRIGVSGRVIISDGKITNIKNISGLNIRIAREVIGCADKLMEYIYENGQVVNTLIVSPPGCGKTTLLRDIVRQISNGWGTIKGVNVGLVDERSEIASCYKGTAQNKIGIRTDIMDNCPKAEGIKMMIRSMAPQVVATDEIGTYEDMEAIIYAITAGVKMIFTAHGESLEDMYLKPGMKDIISSNIFKRIVILKRSKMPR